jgi:flagellar hook-basal body complex protein FliE
LVIGAIPPIPPLPPLSPMAGTNTAAGTTAAGGSAGTAGGSFSSVITNAVDSLQQAQTTASADEAQAAAGQGNLADTMIAATQASLDTQVTTNLLDKAVAAYNDIMSMTF